VNRIRLRLSIFVVMVVSTALTVVGLSASPASADNSCLQIGVTSRVGNDVVGYGSVSCPGTIANLSILQRTWDGWPGYTLATVVVPGPGQDYYVWWHCENNGTQTYRTRIWGYNGENNYVYKDSNEIRFYC
jgi:hypothetical protein